MREHQADFQQSLRGSAHHKGRFPGKDPSLLPSTLDTGAGDTFFHLLVACFARGRRPVPYSLAPAKKVTSAQALLHFSSTG